MTSGSVEVEELPPGDETVKKIAIDFGDSKRSFDWVINAQNTGNDVTVTIEAPMGEQIEPLAMSEEQFINAVLRLSGMQEHCGHLKKPLKPNELYEIANCTNVTGSEVGFFKILVLLFF
ncbi:unnamed protein product [Gongylonema pulchrum]|uniref:AP-3 complex subunit beta-1/2 C-terminal domain-containing protein n=1 Tax=Gongylonema pulchrum TaxID=637853 RepID=A0A3P7NWV0_9BILA|nr:unnamed protein product [Gongylonema pulchrum]